MKTQTNNLGQGMPGQDMDGPSGYITPTSVKYSLFILTIVYCFNFLDRQILVILQEPIKADLGLSDGQLGLLTGFAFALFYVLAALPIAYWADRGNRKNIIALALSIWSAMTAVSGLANNFVQLLLARIGVGIGEAGGIAPAHSMISDYFPKRQRARALSIYSSGLYVGITIGLMLGGYIGQHYGWRIALFVVGLPGVLLALVVFLTVKEPQRGRWDEGSQKTEKPKLKEAFAILKSSRIFWLMTLGASMAVMVAYGVGNFTSSYLIRSHGMGLAEVGFYSALIYGLSGILGTLISGWLADYLGHRNEKWYLWIPGIGVLLSVPFNLIAYTADSLTLILFCVFMFHTFYCMFLTPTISMAHSLVPASMRALTSSIMLFAFNIIGMGIGPTAVGFMSDFYAASLGWGEDSLRYAQFTFSFVGIPAGMLFLVAAASMGKSKSRGENSLEALASD